MKKFIFDLLMKALKKETLTNEGCSLLSREGYYENGVVTPLAYKELEKYKVRNAIIMAAGLGSRMLPLTLTTPKPLVTVNGVSFIETIIEHLLKQDIKEIYIVRGHLKGKFDVLLEKYPFIKFIDNDLYNKENNISSMIKAVDHIGNTYICEADLFITGDNVFQKYQYECNYLGTKVDITDDWCFDVGKDNRAINYRKGGKNCVQAFGVSYWDNKTSATLKKLLNKMYEKEENKQEFWEMCVFEKYKNQFDIKIRLIDKSEIVEIDTIEELASIDKSYINKA